MTPRAPRPARSPRTHHVEYRLTAIQRDLLELGPVQSEPPSPHSGVVYPDRCLRVQPANHRDRLRDTVRPAFKTARFRPHGGRPATRWSEVVRPEPSPRDQCGEHSEHRIEADVGVLATTDMQDMAPSISSTNPVAARGVSQVSSRNSAGKNSPSRICRIQRTIFILTPG